MTAIKVVLGVAASVFALAAAGFWLRASKVEINPGWTTEPADPQRSSTGLATATAWAATQSSELNATAAKFAIASAAATAISSMV